MIQREYSFLIKFSRVLNLVTHHLFEHSVLVWLIALCLVKPIGKTARGTERARHGIQIRNEPRNQTWMSPEPTREDHSLTKRLLQSIMHPYRSRRLTAEHKTCFNYLPHFPRLLFWTSHGFLCTLVIDGWLNYDLIRRRKILILVIFTCHLKCNIIDVWFIRTQIMWHEKKT